MWLNPRSPDVDRGPRPTSIGARAHPGRRGGGGRTGDG